jgi:UDPglucose 6-dehydrogenase
VIFGIGPYADALRDHLPDQPYAWIAEQTRTSADGTPNVAEALIYVACLCRTFPAGTVVVLSTQLPVGSCALLEQEFPELRFVVQPENVRAASATEDFVVQDRIVVGTRHADLHDELVGMLGAFTGRVLFVSPEAAELTKHALNTYLAWCVLFGNELGRICELVGADPGEVVEALRTERRVSSDAPLLPGDPPSSHLLREVHMLIRSGAGPLVQALVA